MHLGLGTFNTADEAARSYGAAAWHLNRPCRDINFSEVMMREWAQRLAPPPWVVTEEDLCRNRRRERRLGIAEMNEHAMAEWRQQFSQDVLDKHAFFVQRRTEQAVYREDMLTRKQAALFKMELKEALTWSDDDERWADAFITTMKLDTNTSEEGDEE
ncbi:Ethylene-responsive transcription factor CRF1 [Hordeum vulgare]|nr:Ethylene-responsive transcription factor CRF1 [Hordeum vulgare]